MLDWLWIPAVTLLILFVLVLCWLFFADYTCCPCKRKRMGFIDDQHTSPSAPATKMDAGNTVLPTAPANYDVAFATSPNAPSAPLLQTYMDPLLPTLSSDVSVRFVDPPCTNVDIVQRQCIENGILTLDLHHLNFEQATEATMTFIRQNMGRYRRVQIITGRGNHTRGSPVLKPAVKILLQRLNLPYVETHHGGCFVVNLVC